MLKSGGEKGPTRSLHSAVSALAKAKELEGKRKAKKRAEGQSRRKEPGKGQGQKRRWSLGHGNRVKTGLITRGLQETLHSLKTLKGKPKIPKIPKEMKCCCGDSLKRRRGLKGSEGSEVQGIGGC